jgi:hypothetical protein
LAAVSFTVDPEIELASISSENTADTFDPTATDVAPADGTVDTTDGAVVSPGGGSVVPSAAAVRLSVVMVVSVVAVVSWRRPMAPAVWGPAELVVCTCQVVGSVVPVFQARARIVVGLVPWTCTRRL